MKKALQVLDLKSRENLSLYLKDKRVLQNKLAGELKGWEEHLHVYCKLDE